MVADWGGAGGWVRTAPGSCFLKLNSINVHRGFSSLKEKNF